MKITSQGLPQLVTQQVATAERGVAYTSLRDLVIPGYLPSVRLGDSRRIWVKRAGLGQLIETSTEHGCA